MKIRSADIPQADNLIEVVQLVEKVAKGATTFQDIATRINKIEYEGRYYRRAAEIIGLVKNFRNHSELTPLGRNLIQTPSDQRHHVLLKAVLGAAIFQRLIPFFERHPHGINRAILQAFITDVTDLGVETMVPHRMSTIINWLESLHIVNKLPNGDLVFEKDTFQQAPAIEFLIHEPLLPKASSLQEYEIVAARIKSTKETITVIVDEAKRERANAEHRKLINLVASRVRRAGAIPKTNQFIDLAALVIERPYIFEMKSITKEDAQSQICDGLSQLYEYRYLQNVSEAILVLVVSTALPKPDAWMHEYLEKDRQIRFLWDGENQLYGSQETRKELAFLW